MRLLVVDWDFFFPVVDPPDDDWQFYDWAHSERHAPLYQEIMWHHRALDFLAHDRPLPHTSGLDISFWERFRFAKRARCYVSNSNLFSMHARVRRAVSEVQLFDAHHDCGYKKDLGKYWTCENWGIWYVSSGTPMTVNYPRWRTHVFDVEEYCMAENAHFWAPVTRQFDPETPLDGTFDKVHICRSDAWTPPWLDGAFERFLAACPMPKIMLETLAQRALDMPQVLVGTAKMRESLALLRHYNNLPA